MRPGWEIIKEDDPSGYYHPELRTSGPIYRHLNSGFFLLVPYDSMRWELRRSDWRYWRSLGVHTIKTESIMERAEDCIRHRALERL